MKQRTQEAQQNPMNFDVAKSLDRKVGPAVVRLEEYVFEPALDSNGAPIVNPETGEQAQEAVAFRGRLVCSGEPVEGHLSEEDREYSRRRSIDEIRLGTDGWRGAHGEMANIESLPIEERPIWKCDYSSFNGEIKDGYRLMETRWITPYCNYADRKGVQRDMLGHVETDAFSTLRFSLRPEYNQIFTRTMLEYGEGDDEKATYSRACWKAADRIVEEHMGKLASGLDDSVGFASVTTWRPERSRCVHCNPSQEDIAAVAAFYASPAFEPRERITQAGNALTMPSPVQPDCILRFLNSNGEVCGHIRVDERIFYSAAREDAYSRGLGMEAVREHELMTSPEARATYVLKGIPMLLGVGSDAESPVYMDFLPGESYMLSKSFTRYGAFGKGAPSNAYEMKSALAGALFQSRLPYHSPTPRQVVGCSQYFISRTESDVAVSLTKPIDAREYVNAVSITHGNTCLPLSSEYAEEVHEEVLALRNFSETMKQALAESRANEMPRQEECDPVEEASANEMVPF